MFEIKKGYRMYENKSLRLPSELISKIQTLADLNEVSFNSIVIQCIEYSLSSMNESSSEKEENHDC